MNNCIKSKKDLKNINELYKPCAQCDNKKLKKSIPIKRQLNLNDINADFKRCLICGKRNIDIVMSHILKILIENGFMNSSSSIRKVGTPLITPAIYLTTLPYLSKDSLVMIINNVDKETANKIVNEVPEVKGVIKGNIKMIIGQLTQNDTINQYELLAGCDIRCDIQNTPTGDIYIYKQQSKIHIEYPKLESEKITELTQILEKYENPTVIDAMSGPGTLGIYALTRNAKHVLFNDIYKEAIETLKLNLEINEIPEDNYTLMNSDLNNLPDLVNEKYDIGIIDAFPSVDVEPFRNSLKKICNEIIII